MRRLLPLVVVLAGCDRYAPTPSRTPTSGMVHTRPVELVPVSVAGLERAVADLRGQVVLVDVWFLGCKPCVKKFPEFVELHTRYADDGLACVSVDLMPSEVPDAGKVLDFLQLQRARFPNYILSDDSARVDAWTERVGVVGTPAYLLFDQAGERVKVAENAKTADVEAAVRRLLGK